jgi:hypothetical protein
MESELFIGAQELPVEKIFQLAAIHRNQLGAGLQAQLVGDGAGLNGGDLDHRAGKMALIRSNIKS